MNGFAQDYITTSKQISDPEDHRILHEDLCAVWKGYKLTIKAGYMTDGASIPRIAWRLVGHPWGPYLPAAVVHDILYQSEIWSRAQADECFLDLMVTLPVGWLRRNAIYRAVRIAGGATWANHTDESIEAAKKYLEVGYV